MLYECNKLNHFIHKYFPLAVSGLLFVLTIRPFLVSDRVEPSVQFLLMTLIPLIFSGSALYVFFRQRPKWKIVALNRVRIVVGTGKAEKEYSWLDVESISLSRILGIYTLYIKNGEEILFAAYGQTNLFTGDTSEMGVIINKMKRDLSL
jgi:hypothetical protein